MAITTSSSDSTELQTTVPDPAAEQKLKRATRQKLLNEISAKWNQFTSPELDRLKNSDELIRQIVIKTGVDKAVAKRDVEAVLKGRAMLQL
jgi:hypothetical protein